MAARAADAATTGVEPLAGGWSSPAYLRVIDRPGVAEAVLQTAS